MRVLFCASPDLNYIDGSSVWAQTFVLALAATGKVDVDYLARSKPGRAHLYQPLREDHRVHIIDGTAVAAEHGAPSRRLVPQAQVDVALRLHGEHEYDVVVVRGLDIADELARRAPATLARAWVYLTDIPQRINEYAPALRDKVTRIATGCRLLLCQSEGFADIWHELVSGLDRTKVKLYTPVIPDLPSGLPVLTERPTRAIYAGKFKPEWKTLDMVNTWPAIASARLGAGLVMIGDKIHNPPEHPQFKAQMIQGLEQTPGVQWLGALSREAVQTELRQARIGLSWRDASMDDIVEYSTKILEYGGAGCAVVLNRNALHEKLLGADYPLFANTEKEYVAAVRSALVDDAVAMEAAARVQVLASEHAFSQRVSELSRWLQNCAPVGRNRVEWVAGQPIRVLLAGHDFKFFGDLQKRLEVKGFQFIEDKWAGHCKHDKQRSLALLQTVNIVVCEWALGNLEWYSKHKRPGQRLVARLHAQEANLNYIRRVNWDAVDQVIFVSSNVRDSVVDATPGLSRQQTIVVANCLDDKKFTIKPGMGDASHTLGMIGVVPLIKRMDRAIDLLEKLLEFDQRYCLRIKGKAPWAYPWLMNRKGEREYYAGLYQRINVSRLLRSRIVFDPPGDDVNEWLRMVGFILSTSERESFHMAVGEGMLAGCVPVVWDWDGARDIWPAQAVVSNTEQACSRVRDKTIRDWAGQELREYVLSRFSVSRTVDAWCDCLMGKGGT